MLGIFFNASKITCHTSTCVTSRCTDLLCTYNNFVRLKDHARYQCSQNCKCAGVYLMFCCATLNSEVFACFGANGSFPFSALLEESKVMFRHACTLLISPSRLGHHLQVQDELMIWSVSFGCAFSCGGSMFSTAQSLVCHCVHDSSC